MRRMLWPYAHPPSCLKQQRQQASDSSVPISFVVTCTERPLRLTWMLNAEPLGGEGRRVRSWWRHEQQTVAAVLATVTHHSHSKVGTANDAPRGLKKVTSTRVGPAEYFELSSDDGRPTGGAASGTVGALAAGEGCCGTPASGTR